MFNGFCQADQMNKTKEELDTLRQQVKEDIESCIRKGNSDPEVMADIIVHDVSWFYYEDKDQEDITIKF
jgi:hypothetical protein